MQKINEISDTIYTVWDNIRKNDISRVDLYEELDSINANINALEKTNLNVSLILELSQGLISIYEFLSLSDGGLDESLKISAIILRNQLKKPVYYIFSKYDIRFYATKLPTFFRTYNITEKITEDKDYVLVKEEKISDLAFRANMILNEEYKPIYEKHHEEETARDFYRKISL